MSWALHVGYYVHHVGEGHRQRAGLLARALSQQLAATVTGLSSSPRPASWEGSWIGLERDDSGARPQHVTAGGRLHWAPRDDLGLLERQGAISSWLREARPALVVVDTSVEVSLLVRLHGVPVLQVLGPGRRDDAAHRLGFDAADALVAFWPAQATDGLMALPAGVRERVQALGGLSRFPVDRSRRSSGRHPRAVLMAGAGGGGFQAADLVRARERQPGWDWFLLGGADWRDDPGEVAATVRQADVVVMQAGQNAVAEVAALHRPCVVVPAPRPHDEQVYTAQVLDSGPWPAHSAGTDTSAWLDLLEPARRVSGASWQGWSDDGAASRLTLAAQAVLDGERR